MDNKQYLLMTFQIYLPDRDRLLRRGIAHDVFLELCQIPESEFAGDIGLAYHRMMAFIEYEYGEGVQPDWVKDEWFSHEL